MIHIIWYICNKYNNPSYISGCWVIAQNRNIHPKYIIWMESTKNIHQKWVVYSISDQLKFRAQYSNNIHDSLSGVKLKAIKSVKFISIIIHVSFIFLTGPPRWRHSQLLYFEISRYVHLSLTKQRLSELDSNLTVILLL